MLEDMLSALREAHETTCDAIHQDTDASRKRERKAYFRLLSILLGRKPLDLELDYVLGQSSRNPFSSMR